MKYRCIIGLLSLSAATLGPAMAQDVAGGWAGSYRCEQGLTALDLELWPTGASGIEGLFHFFADPTNPAVPEGCYRLHGERGPGAGQITLQGVEWLKRPSGYVMVDLSGTIDGDRFAGRMALNGCGKFTLHRNGAAAEPPPACASSGPPVS